LALALDLIPFHEGIIRARLTLFDICRVWSADL
jgi:hypothetical protein